MKLRLVATVKTSSFNYEAGLMDTTAGWSYHAPREGAELGDWRDKYEYVDFFLFGLASAMRIVKGKEKWGYVNEEGKEVVKAKYDKVSDTHNGLAWVMLNGKYGFVNRKGKVVIALKYDYVDGFSEEGLANVKLNREWGKVDRNGKEYWDDDEMDFEGPHPGAAGGSNYNYTASEDWRKKYDAVGNFYEEGLAMVELNGKMGYVNKKGEKVIPLKYDAVGRFSEGLAGATLNGKWGFINLKGEEVVPVKCDSYKDATEALDEYKRQH